MAGRVPLIAAATLALGLAGCAEGPEQAALPQPGPTAPAAATSAPQTPPAPRRPVRDVRVLGDGEILITLTPDGLAQARGRDGARMVARVAARAHAPLRPWAVPHLSGEIRAHALAHASGIGGGLRRRANPVNVELGDYRTGTGDGRWRALG